MRKDSGQMLSKELPALTYVLFLCNTSNMHLACLLLLRIFNMRSRAAACAFIHIRMYISSKRCLTGNKSTSQKKLLAVFLHDITRYSLFIHNRE